MEIIVRPDGTIRWLERRTLCVLGRAGIAVEKHEGDGATPAGRFALRRVLFRPDRTTPPATVLPVNALNPSDGWCDDPADVNYNRPVTLPYAARHEKMWREDGLYDLVVVIGHNDDPPIAGAGSVVFIHVAAMDFTPTEGCVALKLGDLRDLLAACDGKDFMRIIPEGD